MKAKKKVLELAYCQVNSISMSVVKEEEHQKIISEALTEVWSYAGLYPGENDILRDKRLDMESPANGEGTELAQHFKELYPEDFGSSPLWVIIFTMYNRLKGMYSKNEGEVVPNEDKPSDKFKEEKEIKNMENKEAMKQEERNEASIINEARLSEVQAALSTSGETDIHVNAGIDVGGDILPNGVNENAYAAAQEKMENEKNERLLFSKTAIVTKIVLSKPAAKVLAVDGENAKGIIKDVEGTFKNFMDKTGLEMDKTTEQPIFKKVPTSYLDEAKMMYDALMEARSNPKKEFDVFFSKSTGTVRAYLFRETENDESVYVSEKEIIDIIMSKSIGAIKTAEEGAQLRIEKVEPKKNKTNGNKGDGTIKPKSQNQNVLKGIASLKISKKKEALEKICDYHQEIDKSKGTEEQTGMRSDMFIKYYRNKKDQDDDQKIGTWRIPLLVNQYVLSVIDEKKLKEIGPASRGVGRQIEPINFDDDAVVTKEMKEISEIMGLVVKKGLSTPGSVYEDVAMKAEAKTATANQAEVDELAGINL